MSSKDPRMEYLRRLIKGQGIPMYAVADAIGIYPSTLSVWFRKYDEGHYRKIMDAIEKIEGGNDCE